MGDDDDLEAGLGSLREALRGMRDEEPSDRGLASLMAAARAQAAVMAPAPTWWERVVVALRRPPVLALASAALLVGGGLLITRHADDLDATATPSATAAAPSATAAAPLATAAAPSATTPRDLEGAATVEPAPTAGAAAVEPAPTAGSAELATGSAKGQAARPEPRGAPSSSPSPPSASPRGRPTTNTSKPAGGSAPADPPADPVETTKAVSDRALVTADRADSPTNPRPDARQPPAPGDGDPARTAAEGPAVATPEAVTPAQVLDLATRCEQAATRGECATVRTLARKVEAASPSTYRSRLRTNPDVARCLGR